MGTISSAEDIVLAVSLLGGVLLAVVGVVHLATASFVSDSENFTPLVQWGLSELVGGVAVAAIVGAVAKRNTGT